MSNHEQTTAETEFTRIGRGILIKGEIEGEGDVLVEGRVEGNIAIRGNLHIDVDGQVKSSVSARNVYVQGILVGTAVASEKIELAPGGRMVGDVRTPRFLINEGAAYRGAVDMVDFEADDRAGEAARSARLTPAVRARGANAISARANADARREVSSPRPAPSPRPATSAPRPGATVFNPPPFSKPPELVGIKKSIIIKKKTGDAS